MNNPRIASITRNTKETQIELSINLDGNGNANIATGIPFFDHMLTLLAKHSLIDLDISCKGDIDVDYHHTVEDLGLALGSAINEALGDRCGINRYGFFLLPMDESLCQLALDLGGRPFLVYSTENTSSFVRDFDVNLFEEFFRALSTNARMNLHVKHTGGNEAHHAAESIFKAFAHALRIAVEYDKRNLNNIPSSKGVI